MTGNNFCNTDIAEWCKNTFNKINSLDKKTFIWIFAVLNFVFIFHTIHFLFGYHDWDNITQGVNWNTFFYNGRYCGTIIKMLFFHGQVLPIINNLIAFSFYALGITMLLNYLEAPKNLMQRVIIGLTLTITPFTNVWIFFQYHTIENLSIPFFVVSALMLSLKNFDSKSIILGYSILSIILLIIALGIYPSAVVNILTIFSCKITADIISNNFENIKSVFIKHKRGIINILCSFVIYKTIITYMTVKQLIYPFETIMQARTPELLNNFYQSVQIGFKQLYFYNTISMPESITIVFWILFVIMLGLFCINVEKLNVSFYRKIKSIFIFFLCITTIIIMTKIASIIATTYVAYNTRIDFYGLVFFRGFIVLLLFKYGNIFIKNIVYMLVFIILWESIIANFVCQKSIYFATSAEYMHINRIIEQIYSNKNYVPGRKYDAIIIGIPFSMRTKYTPQKYKDNLMVDYALGSDSLLPAWEPFVAVEFFMEENIINNTKYYNCYNIHDIINDLDDNDRKFLKNVIHKLSSNQKDRLQIIDDKIIYVFDEFALQMLKKDLKTIKY